ncbi:hypothetical protein GCM10025876_22020 [Demequina litorisediminis]|uniref:Uncharacterized protein n=1 Tax=Demequina litorisediminis TaxID=1849022 RepID=A0ABQ6IFT7_9MICO|nr:hypothetical protein GCM10025876_22020 [Demequina litorisediminis]
MCRYRLDEGGLDLGVAAVAVGARGVGAELLHGEVGEAAGDGQEVVCAGGAGAGDRGLDQVAQHVQFVAPAHVPPRLLIVVALHVRVQVAVLALHAGEQRGGVGGERFPALVLGHARCLPRDGLEGLVEVGIGEVEAPVGRFGVASEAAQVVHDAAGLEPRDHMGDGALAVEALPCAQFSGAVERDCGEGQGREVGGGRGARRGRAGGPC